jgi:hypothetical protein
MGNKQSDQYSDKEVERRATEALRRALSLPYKPQRAMVGKVGRAAKAKTKRAKESRKKI